MKTIPAELYKGFMEIVEKGTEKEAREFLVKNLGQFPEGVRNRIITAFFEQALNEEKADTETLLDFGRKSLEANKEIEKIKEELRSKAKLLEIKDSI